MTTGRREAGAATLAASLPALLAMVAVLGVPVQAQTVGEAATVDQARARPGAEAGVEAGADALAPQQGVVPAGKPAPPAGDEVDAAPQTAPDPAPDPSPPPAPETAPAPSEEAAPQAAPETAPEPAPDPAADSTKASVVEQARAAAAATPAEPPRPQLLAERDLDLGTCLGRLQAFGTVFERGRSVAEQGGACGIVNPVRVTEIVPGVTLSPPGIMRCETAAALAAWVARFALPASTMLPDRGRLTEVTQGSAYICRGIDNASGGTLSEHAYGNAIDVMAFRFASGLPIAIEPREREGTLAEGFQRTVRAAACLGFTTVLGPGQEEHDDHLHLDIKERDSGYRLCQ